MKTIIALLSAVCLGAVYGLEIERSLYRLEPAAATEFTSSSPETVKVSSDGQALSIRVLKKAALPVEVVLPVAWTPELPAPTARELELRLEMRIQDSPERPVQFRFRQEGGGWARTFKPNRDWDTLYDPVASKWNRRDGVTARGKLSPTTQKGELVLLVNPATGAGTIEIFRLELVEIRHIRHQFNSGTIDHTVTAESGTMEIRFAEFGPVSSASVTPVLPSRVSARRLAPNSTGSVASAKITLPAT